MIFWFPKSTSLSWTSHQARDWKVIRCQPDPTHLMMTSISPRMTWTRLTSSRPRPSQETSRTVGQRERLVLCSLALMSKAKHLCDQAEKHLPSETAAAVAHITIGNLQEKMCLVSIRCFGHTFHKSFISQTLPLSAFGLRTFPHSSLHSSFLHYIMDSGYVILCFTEQIYTNNNNS